MCYQFHYSLSLPSEGSWVILFFRVQERIHLEVGPGRPSFYTCGMYSTMSWIHITMDWHQKLQFIHGSSHKLLHFIHLNLFVISGTVWLSLFNYFAWCWDGIVFSLLMKSFCTFFRLFLNSSVYSTLFLCTYCGWCK